MPAAGGTPQVALAFDPATEIDFHTVSALPDNRVLVTTHLRKDETSYRVELIDFNGGTRRMTLLADAAIIDVQYVFVSALNCRRH